MSSYRLPLLACLAVAGCSAKPSAPLSGGLDLAKPGAVDAAMGADQGTSGCQGDQDCAAPTPWCVGGSCVACRMDQDCPEGNLCAGGACRPGCTEARGCGDAGLCDVDAGSCRSCKGDAECTEPGLPRCEVATGLCVPCLPANDNCGSGKFCTRVNGAYTCRPGCNRAEDCTNLDGGGGGAATPACCEHRCVDVANDTVNCGGCGMGCAMGSACCGANCVVVASDVKNCGACGKACGAANAMASCAAGKCRLDKCNPGFADCDKNIDNGCEVDLARDPQNCGACGMTCQVAHGTAGCNGGCVIAACDPGFADCDKDAKNGCETDTGGDLKNCGACGMVCGAVMNGVGACAGGKCAIASCNGSFADCNMSAMDGCEVDTASDVGHCGKCGMACGAVMNGTPACGNGLCGVGKCNGAFLDCNGKAADGCEVDGQSDTKHCGACGKACGAVANGVAGCAMGVCGVASCSGLFRNCNGDSADGCEVDLATDEKSCGQCGMVCPNPMNGAPSCVMGKCGVAMCGPPFSDCNMNPMDGCETDTSADVNHCGMCGMKCGAVMNGTPGCKASKCVTTCGGAWRDCNGTYADGCEINTGNDANHCNACGNKCPAIVNGTPGCANGACGIATCTAPFKDCRNGAMDGCETNSSTDVNNCGACGMKCAAVPNGVAGCAASKCGIASCNAPFADCNAMPGDGCEANTSTDVNHCGKCALKCPAVNNGTPGCSASKCGISTCNAPFNDCNQNAADGCEVNTSTDAKNCGDCGAVCPSGVCTNGACKDKVLLVAADYAQFATDVQSKLLFTGAFATVDLHDATVTTPSLAKLQGYQAVLVWSNYSFVDATALGNNLATYYDGGGRVVVAVFANSSPTYSLKGRFGTPVNGYVFVNPVGFASANEQGALQIVEPQSPLVTGVTSLTATNGFRATGALVNGGVAVAKWGGGAPLIVRGVAKGRPRVDLNFFPPSGAVTVGGWAGHGANILRNALQYDLYKFPGVKKNVPVNQLTGWTQCFGGTYAGTASIATVLQACTGANLLLGCRPVGSSTLTLAAHAPRADVTFNNNGQTSCGGAGIDVPRNANGVGWYFSPTWSWGFAPQGNTLNRCSCDIGNTVANDLRMCWHTGSNNLTSGYRCGNNNLNGDATWERVIYQAN